MKNCPFSDLANPHFHSEGKSHEAFRTLRSEEPISWQVDKESGVGFWAVTKRRHIDLISKSPELFSSAEKSALYDEFSEEELTFLRLLVINMDPPHHLRYRRIVRNAFSPKNVDLLEPKIRRVVAAAIEKTIQARDCDFVAEMADKIPMQVICELMGVPSEDRGMLLKWSHLMVGSSDPAVAEEKRAITVYGDFLQYGRKIIELHKFKSRGPIVDALLNSETPEGDRLTVEEFCSFFLMLVVAGNETTGAVMSNGMKLLLDSPDRFEAMKNNKRLVTSAVEEFLRYEPAVIQHRRTAMSDVEIDGVKIKKGDKLVLFYQSANRDDEVFANPDEFVIDRGLQGNLAADHRAFGIGQHFCLGAHLARMELQIFFEELVGRARKIQAAGPAIKLVSNTFNSYRSLPITICCD